MGALKETAKPMWHVVLVLIEDKEKLGENWL